jgi:hypothetical protein
MRSRKSNALLEIAFGHGSGMISPKNRAFWRFGGRDPARAASQLIDLKW